MVLSKRAMNVITVDHLTKLFPLAEPPVTAFSNLSFTVHAGEFVCIVGPSGCGKTTLLRVLAGLDAPSSGSVQWQTDGPVGARPSLALAFQDALLLPWLSLRDNVKLSLSRSAHGSTVQAADDWLRRLGLHEFASFYPHQVSGGMRQRANLARALVVNPQLLLLDEPFAFLDFQTRLGLQQLLLDLWQQHQRTILFVTHDLDEAVTLADRVIVLSAHPGRIQAILNIPLARPRQVAALRGIDEYRACVQQLLSLLPPSQVDAARI